MKKKVICKIRLSFEMSICIDVSNENLFIEIPRKRNFFFCIKIHIMLHNNNIKRKNWFIGKTTKPKYMIREK